MAYEINCTIDVAGRIIKSIKSSIQRSRFVVGQIAANTKGRKTSVAMSQIRLKESKSYCQNHCGPCRNQGVQHHRKAKYLEGADWVAFNDMVNDVLDRLNHNGNAGSSVCVVRKGKCRRVDYFGVDGGEFDKEGNNYVDYCKKKALASECQNGTPGILQWKLRSKNERL